jgi:hypothetical protein
VLQRNPGPYPLTLPTLDPPREVQEGDVIDHPTLLAGFVPVDEQADPEDLGETPPGEPSGPVDQAQGDGQEPAKKKTTSRGGRRADDAPEATQ